MRYREDVQDFLAQKNIAVIGYSRSGDNPGNHIYKRLRESGINAVVIHPQGEDFEEDVSCFADLKSVQLPIDGVMMTAPPEAAMAVVQQCVEIGIPRIWLHRSFGKGSVATEAVTFARQNGIKVIEGGCPMMFIEPVDVFHKCMLWMLKKTGGVPVN